MLHIYQELWSCFFFLLLTCSFSCLLFSNYLSWWFLTWLWNISFTFRINYLLYVLLVRCYFVNHCFHNRSDITQLMLVKLSGYIWVIFFIFCIFSLRLYSRHQIFSCWSIHLFIRHLFFCETLEVTFFLFLSCQCSKILFWLPSDLCSTFSQFLMLFPPLNIFSILSFKVFIVIITNVNLLYSWN